MRPTRSEASRRSRTSVTTVLWFSHRTQTFSSGAALQNWERVDSRSVEKRPGVDGQLLAGTTPITESKRCKTGVVTDREALAIDDTEDGAEAAISDIGFPAVLHLEIGDVERTLCKSDLPTFLFRYLGTRRDAEIPRRIEGTRIFPMNRVHAGSGVRRIDVAVPS